MEVNEDSRRDRPLLVRVDEAARLLSLARSTVYDLINTGVLPVVRVRRRAVRIPLKALEDFVAGRAT